MAFAWVVWLAAALGIVYIIAGYPLLLRICRARLSPPVMKDPAFEPTVSVIVAVLNGAAYLRAKLDVLLGLDYPKDRLQIIIVSDGSTDETDAIAESYADRGVILIRAPRSGKASALNLGMARASGEVLFFTDVRQPIEAGALRHLVANLADASVGAVTGEMRLYRGDRGEQADMDLYWRYEVWARSRHSEIDSIFTVTGCIYAIRREFASPIPPDTLTDDATLALRAFFRGYRVVLDRAAIAWDSPAISGTEFRRRFRTLAGLWQLHARFPALLTGRNRMRWHFLSQKSSRLILPWLLLAALAATFAMTPGAVRTWLLAAELTPVVLAAMNSLVPAGSPLKRLCSPARTFLSMNAAALCAIAVFFVPAATLWKPTSVGGTHPGSGPDRPQRE